MRVYFWMSQINFPILPSKKENGRKKEESEKFELKIDYHHWESLLRQNKRDSRD